MKGLVIKKTMDTDNILDAFSMEDWIIDKIMIEELIREYEEEQRLVVKAMIYGYSLYEIANTYQLNILKVKDIIHNFREDVKAIIGI